MEGGEVFQPAGYSGQPHNYIGLYGWRKRCLYLLVLLLAVMLLVNLGLTAWILAVLNFNINGMGNVEITDSGIRLDGPAEFIGPLYAQNISTDQGSSLLVTSQKSIELAVDQTSSIHVGTSSINISTMKFSVHGPEEGREQRPILSVSSEGVCVGAAELRVTGPLGLNLNRPLETSQVQSPANQDLQLQSLSGKVEVRGGSGVIIHDGSTGSGGVTITSQADISLSSQTGQIVLSGRGLVLQGVPRAAENPEGVYEVCACSDGRLYFVPANSDCEQDTNIC